MLILLPILLHLVVSVAVSIGIALRILSVHKAMILPTILLPLWGVVIVMVLHFHIAFNKEDSAQIGVEKLKLDSELYKSIHVEESKTGLTVPMEEALLINSARERRSLIMDVLNDNPANYVEFLQKAGNNDDTEVVHYAVTAMVELSKDNDFTLQKLQERHENDPDNMKILSEYIDFLWNCLSQNMMQGQVEVLNRELISTLLSKKIAKEGTTKDYARLAENELIRKEYAAAGSILRQMGERWPHSEEYILLNIQYLASQNKGKEIASFIRDTENGNIFLSSKTKEALAFWAS